MNRRTEHAMRTVVAMADDVAQHLPDRLHGPFAVAVTHMEAELERIDRAHAEAAAFRKRRTEGWWKLTAAKKVVHARSGGVCELRAPGCQGKAHDVHHVFGRGGSDPHNPSKLLHLCGFGNTSGCHGLVHQTAEWRDAARLICHDLASGVTP